MEVAHQACRIRTKYSNPVLLVWISSTEQSQLDYVYHAPGHLSLILPEKFHNRSDLSNFLFLRTYFAILMKFSISNGPWLEFSVEVMVFRRICVDKRWIKFPCIKINRSIRLIATSTVLVAIRTCRDIRRTRIHYRRFLPPFVQCRQCNLRHASKRRAILRSKCSFP